MTRIGDDSFEAWLRARQHRVVLIRAAASAAFPRSGHKDFDTFRQLEYASRDSLYEMAAVTVSVNGLNEAKAGQKVCRVIRRLFEVLEGQQA